MGTGDGVGAVGADGQGDGRVSGCVMGDLTRVVLGALVRGLVSLRNVTAPKPDSSAGLTVNRSLSPFQIRDCVCGFVWDTGL